VLEIDWRIIKPTSPEKVPKRVALSLRDFANFLSNNVSRNSRSAITAVCLSLTISGDLASAE
jgi:hypothetical protein